MSRVGALILHLSTRINFVVCMIILLYDLRGNVITSYKNWVTSSRVAENLNYESE